MQSTPLKKKKSIIQKIKTFFNDIPDQQIAVINEASYKRPPQIKKSQSVVEEGSKSKKQDPKHKYSEELYEEIHEVNHVELGE
ncbi:unnamed protein product [Paramecium octaurelia]|uniref:Uncharacterized protein n=1 Tax=Paramecium octaurelia TaxID=43137 RepID=A0A8S1VKN0_PAROT|nr:unnamed protein product [Paramecium octaurelia]CAD8175240.1 unnamed protein product [Paramecium octaurelia]CAD8175244.1 unnamed protein product [Paramecium octaurelia]